MANTKTYLVTGAGRGIGLELVRQLLAHGANVIATLRDPKKAEPLLNLEREASGRLRIETLDVGSDESTTSFVRRLQGTAVDVLINNAGILDEANESLDELSVASVQRQLETNAVGPLRITKALLPCLRLSKSPTVANLSSLMGSIADNKGGGAYGYRMSKTALNMFTKSLSIDEPDFTVVCFHPGWVRTEMGGTQAPTEIPESAQGLLKVLGELGKADSGKFYDYRGKALPW